MFGLVVMPVVLAWSALLLCHLAGRGGGTALLIVMSLCGYLMVQFSPQGFRKIPFACSYLPGKANLHPNTRF